jgi:acyl-coenzyme A thioesterase PaaI-like protein
MLADRERARHGNDIRHERDRPAVLKILGAKLFELGGGWKPRLRNAKNPAACRIRGVRRRAHPMSDIDQPAGPPAAGAPAIFDPAAAGWEPYTDEGFVGLVGPFWTRRSGDTHLYAFLAQPKHHNRRGIVQGGMLMTFADRSMGMTCWYANERQPQATVQLDMHFIDAVQIGEFVEAKCRVVRRTRALVFMSAELVVGARLVATANGVWKTLGKR